ncbi:MAG: hypothetical protein ORN49_02425 [Rhodobacteraceae bacterium]|nr:hypothetical protein [Paracoccaceae bacterium]
MFSLSFSTVSARTGRTAAPSGTVTVTPFSADRIIYDSRAAFGANAANIPLAGAGTAGQIVEARAQSVDDGGATSTAWAEIATIGAGGSWSGSLTVPRSASWYRPEVRLKASPGVLALGANRFGVGHVLAIWGQSEFEYITNPFYSGGTLAAVADPEAVQIYYGASGSPARQFVSTASPLTNACAALAASLIATRPGEKFAVILQAVAGTDPRALVDDTDPSRNWANDKALHDLATADGRTVGLVTMSWFASPQGLAASYGEFMIQLIAKKTLAGADAFIPGTITYTGGSARADHWFGELYDYTKTKWVIEGPHRFDIDADMIDATHLVGGAIVQKWKNIELCRQSWRAMLTSPAATMFLPAGLDAVTYSNGRSDGAGGWTDMPHPSPTADGSPALAQLTVLGMLQAAGLCNWQVPLFDNCYWEPSGAYVEVWSSAGAITTTRLARGEAALPATYPHWTAVMGFQVNGAPVQNASIVAGRVRITRNGGGNFIFSDVLTYGEGGAVGQMKFPQDQLNATWKNLPIVALAGTGLTGIPVKPMPAAAALANTLPANPSFTTVTGLGTYFRDTANWPTTGGKITLALDMALQNAGGTVYPFDMGNIHISGNITTAGDLRLTLKDSAGTTLMSNVTVATYAWGVRKEVIVAIDLVALTCWVTVGGVTTAYTLAANSGILASASRRLRMLARENAAGGNCIGTFYRVEVWTDCLTGGGRPATDANLRANGRIVGPASLANAHAWKNGGAVV